MNKNSLSYQKIWLMVGIAMILFVVYETLTPSPIRLGVKVSDKMLHMLGYFGMMGWFVQIYNSREQRALMAAGFILLGIMLEFVQGRSGVRYFEVADMLANTSGVVLAWILSFTRFADGLSFVERKLLCVESK